MIDFGLAAQVEAVRKESTAHFMAPEIMRVNRELEGAFYGLAADAWSFGIWLYYFYMYYMPFADDENIVRDIYNIVLYQHEGLPEYVEFDDDGLVVIIQALLSRRPEDRPTFADLQYDSFFHEIDWRKLWCRQLRAPLDH